MAPLKDDRFLFLPDAASFKALDFLERSRDVASEVVVDGRSRETSTSRREEVAVADLAFAT
jgi:hypothetical protein